ncbi:SDR family NAD(P)-dependent oxidoreductase [Streptomyces sp. NPDC002787]
MAADLNEAEAVERLRADPAKDHADAALLVNAAGVFAPKPFVDHTAEDCDRYQALNLAFFFLTPTVVGNMIARGTRGSVVNVGPCGPTRPSPRRRRRRI